MLNVAHHTIRLQDGTICNFKKRLLFHHKSLFNAFETVKDGRGKFGKRHSLSCMLALLFGGITAGATTLKDCHLWALHNRRFLRKFVSFPHGIPDPTMTGTPYNKTNVHDYLR